MKRVIFIEKTNTIADKTGSVIGLRANSRDIPDLVIPSSQKVRIFQLPLTLKAQGDVKDFHLSFRASKELVDNGVLLVGAYHEGEAVTFAVINFGNDLRLKEKQVILEVALTEEVRFFQHDNSNPHHHVIQFENGPKSEWAVPKKPAAPITKRPKKKV